jgi:hypothetical protein
MVQREGHRYNYCRNFETAFTDFKIWNSTFQLIYLQKDSDSSK